MPIQGKFGITPFLGAAALFAAPLFAAPNAVSGHLIAGNKPAFVASSASTGPVNPAETIEVSIWLNPHNKAELDQLAKDLYDRDSPSYRRWLTKADFTQRFAPTAEEAAVVKTFFASHGLQVVSTGPDNMFVRARGTVATVQSAFHTTLNQYTVKGKTLRGNATEPFVEGPAADLVQAVAGLDNAVVTHPNAQRAVRTNNGSMKLLKFAQASDESGEFYTNNCFNGPTTKVFADSSTVATYKGNSYVLDPSSPGCGYGPPDIWKAYGLDSLYKAGHDGTGQTIVIIDWCGSPTITADANAFSARYGLPPLTSSNFQIINYPGPSSCAAEDAEINIDVEWAHAIAPGASITLLVPPSATFADINEAQFYAENYGLGNVISGSYGAEEYYLSASLLNTQNLINEIGAVLGISANFSSADDGDYTFDFPGIPASVSAPADSPYATAVGGVSLALNASGSIKFQAGWGNNATEISADGAPTSTPVNLGFIYGAGGGPSAFFPKPAYQSGLSGTTRKLPDIAWLADPFTGGVIAISEPGVYPAPGWQVYGGTSLACPMFSALWAIANQEAGTPLGQAAPYLYKMPKSLITDIQPVGSATNVTGSILDLSSGTTTNYSAGAIAAPYENSPTFLSAFWNDSFYDVTYVLTFGTDSHLKTGYGWDNVTGLGVPAGAAFADYFNPAATSKK